MHRLIFALRPSLLLSSIRTFSFCWFQLYFSKYPEWAGLTYGRWGVTLVVSIIWSLITWVRMILLLSFWVCPKLLYCYIAVYNSPLLAARSFWVSKPLFFCVGGPLLLWDSTLKSRMRSQGSKGKALLKIFSLMLAFYGIKTVSWYNVYRERLGGVKLFYSSFFGCRWWYCSWLSVGPLGCLWLIFTCRPSIVEW